MSNSHGGVIHTSPTSSGGDWGLGQGLVEAGVAALAFISSDGVIFKSNVVGMALSIGGDVAVQASTSFSVTTLEDGQRKARNAPCVPFVLDQPYRGANAIVVHERNVRHVEIPASRSLVDDCRQQWGHFAIYTRRTLVAVDVQRAGGDFANL